VADVRARPIVRVIVGNLAVAVGYWLFAQLGSLAQYTGNIEVAWLPVGFAAGMLYLGDLRWFVGGMVGDFVVGSNFGFAFPWDGPDLVATAGPGHSRDRHRSAGQGERPVGHDGASGERARNVTGSCRC
jgi:hypothetical protein